MNPVGDTGWRRRLKVAKYRYSLFTHHFADGISIAGRVVDSISVVASLACLVSLIVLAGYDHNPSDLALIRNVLRGCQTVFAVQVAYNILFRIRHMLRASRIIKWVTDILVLSTLIQYVYPQPAHPWIPVLEHILYSRYYLHLVLAAYSIVEFSQAVMGFVSRRTNPSLLLTGSFLFFILLGSFVLMLPKCTTMPLSYVDSLFIATSGVCITGLTPVDVASVFTPTGLIILAVLIQIGGIGVLTFTSFFALFFSGTTSVYNQLLIRDMVYSKTMNALIPTLVYIICFTLSVEAIGAVAIYFSLPDTLGMDTTDKLIFSGFHSLSSFCNAGFSCLPGGMANPHLMTQGQALYNITSVIILAGGIGFPILVNFKDIIFNRLSALWKRLRGLKPDIPLHLFDLNTKLVLFTTFAIMILGSLAFFVFEYNNTMRGLTLWQKISQSIFNSLIPRSVGFTSLDPTHFLPITLMLIVIQMWIGGASQSLAGGIKVNTVAVIFLNVRSVLSSGQRPWAFDRSISVGSVRRANTVIVLALFSFFIFLGAVIILEPGQSLKALSFEVTSALFTVGSSLGVTSSLCDTSKVLLCMAMLLGRVGIVSILSGFFRQRDISSHLPQENVIIN